MKRGLTTGQMIDTLQYNQIAINNTFGTCVIRKSFGFLWCENDGSYKDKDYFVISDMTIDAKWNILL